MESDEDLFGSQSKAEPIETPDHAGDSRVPDWQIKQLRRALDERGLPDMASRQALVERLVGRPVSALRSLSSGEALSLLEKLTVPSSKGSSSAWDTREADTWIDRL